MLLLVVGTGRCGSTLVTELLARHPDVGFVSGVDDKLALLNLKGRFNSALYRRSAPRPPQARALGETTGLPGLGRARVAPSEGWRLLDRVVTPGISKPCHDLCADDLTPALAERLHSFFDDRAQAQRKDVFMHHVTGWPRTGLLHAAFPDLRVVHVVRDGRAVANSMLQMGWWDGWRGPRNWYLGPIPRALEDVWEASGRSFAALAGIGWAMLEDAFDEARDRIPQDQWLDVRYEDLLRDPEPTIGKMLDLIGLPWSSRFASGLRKHRLEPARSTAYLKQLSKQQIHDIEVVASRQLERWGYVGRESLLPAAPDGRTGVTVLEEPTAIA